MHFEVLSLFPRYIEGPIQESILKRAIQKGLITVSSVDIRSFATRKDGRVDDHPYGGGPGMVMMAEPVVSAIRSCKKDCSRVVSLSPRGTPLTPQLARELSSIEHLILVCGHYEGIDERALQSAVDMEVSIGDYVLTNGCLAALVLIDTVARYLPGVIGHEEGAASDSFERGLLEYPQYTVPRLFEGAAVPEVLLSGDHKKIAEWRSAEALRITRERRPELVAKAFPMEGGSRSDSSLNGMVKPTSNIEKICSFYRKITGTIPEVQEGRAIFRLGGMTLGFMQAHCEIKDESILYLELEGKQFAQARRWWEGGNREGKKEADSHSFLCTDPDCRIVVVYNKK